MASASSLINEDMSSRPCSKQERVLSRVASAARSTAVEGSVDGSCPSLSPSRTDSRWNKRDAGLRAINGSLSRRLSTDLRKGSAASSFCSTGTLSPEKKRSGTGRFYSEELSCFKRVPTPSSMCSLFAGSAKADWVNQPVLKRVFSEGSVDSRPGSSTSGFGRSTPSPFGHRRGSDILIDQTPWDWTSPCDVERQGNVPTKLPLEDTTESVLEQIFPKKFRPGLESGANSPARLKRHRPLSGKKFLATPLAASPDGWTGRASCGTADTRSEADGSAIFDSEPSQPSKQQSKRRLLRVRQKLLDKFQTIKGAFELFAVETENGLNRELNRKQFSRFLKNHFQGLSKEEHASIFDFLDADKNGHVSLEEFHVAIEASAPAKNLEDLRRKLISLGFLSMRQALQAMIPKSDDDHKSDKCTTSRPLTLQEFGVYLSRVGVEEEEEHQAIFTAISDPHDSRGTVTIDQLCSALAAVSPALLLEDLRDRLLKKFSDLDTAFAAIDLQQGETNIRHPEFMRYVAEHFKLTSIEARKAYDLIDLDGGGSISRSEFVSAFRLSEPNLYLEELRRKVRQRFRSMAEAFSEDQDELLQKGVDMRPAGRYIYSVTIDVPTDESAVASPILSPSAAQRPAVLLMGQENTKENRRYEAKRASQQKMSLMKAFQNSMAEAAKKENGKLKDCSDFVDTMKSVQLSESDTKLLFDLVDIDRNGRVSPKEFTMGMRRFAPSCLLEDLRLHCLRISGDVADAFKHVPQERREITLDYQGFAQLLIEDVGICGETVDTSAIFSLLESRRDGGVTVSEIIAALKCATPGSQVPLSSDQRKARARQQIKWQLAPFRRTAGELRGELRATAKQSLKLASSDRTLGTVDFDASSRPDSRQDPRAHGPTKQSYKRLTRLLRDTCSAPTMEPVHGYYASAGTRLGEDVPLFGSAQSRSNQHVAASKHRAQLGGDAPPQVV